MGLDPQLTQHRNGDADPILEINWQIRSQKRRTNGTNKGCWPDQFPKQEGIGNFQKIMYLGFVAHSSGTFLSRFSVCFSHFIRVYSCVSIQKAPNLKPHRSVSWSETRTEFMLGARDVVSAGDRAQIVHFMPTNICTPLKRARIDTAGQLLRCHIGQVSKLSGLSQDQIEDAQRRVASQVYPHILCPRSVSSIRSGHSLVYACVERSWCCLWLTFAFYDRVPFQCQPLDDLLRGGVHAGGITEVVGRSGVGKTQLCLQACDSPFTFLIAR
jgi:hypothetical protein